MSINQYMKNTIPGQRIWRRKKMSLRKILSGEKLKVRGDSRPVYHTELIRQIRQKPAFWRRRRITKYRAPELPFHWPNFPVRQKVQARSGKKGRGFSFPAPPLWAILALAGVLAFGVLGLRWQDVAAVLSLPHTFSPEPPPDGQFQRNLASYAGLNPQPAATAPDEAIPLDLTETFSWSTYRVKQGDSVSKIAAAHSISMDAIIASNGISNARRLRVGETLRLPNMDGIPYVVKKGDSLSKISTAMGVPLAAILDANDIQTDTITQGTMLFVPGARMRSEDLKMALGELFIYPIRGRLTSTYGWRSDPISGVRRFHAAIDLAAPIGVPVKAAMDGRVSAAGVNSTYGKFIIITHSGGYQTLYAHMNAFAVKQGAYVEQGAKIGEVGNTGYSTGPHLHFSIYRNGKAQNPLDFLNR
jgi:murein DD-endopeptidase MepM/ murein hydrolase activator NlpD